MLLLFLAVNWGAGWWVSWLEIQRSEADVELWEPALWEGSSHLVIFALLPLMLWWDNRFPIRIGQLRRSIAIHCCLTLPFCVLHVSAMVGLRELVYWLMGGDYHFGNVGVEFFYEYLKDFRTYYTILAIIYLYRFIILHLQGAAEFISEESVDEVAHPVTDRFLVKKLDREFLVKVDDIDWVEAAGNYVNLHVGGRLYPLRETMTGIEGRLDAERFRRVHRSAIVNLDRVQELVSFDSGEAQACLRGDVRVPVSRRYRKQLRHTLAQAAS